MRVRQDKYGRKGNIVMASLTTEEQAKLANEYKHKNQTNNLSNYTQEKDKRYRKTVDEKQLQERRTCYACVSKEHLLKSSKRNANLFVTNEKWPDMSEEELKYFLEYGTISIV